MRVRIYLENHEIALQAEEACHQEAKKRGYDNWKEWFRDEWDNEDLDLYRNSSYRIMLGITNEYREKITRSHSSIG